MKRYVIAGHKDTFDKYLKDNSQVINEGVVFYARTANMFDEITTKDTIVLLYGWWAKSWAKDALNEIMQVYPTINFEYLDGPFGEKERKSLKSETIYSRFDILDL